MRRASSSPKGKPSSLTVFLFSLKKHDSVGLEADGDYIFCLIKVPCKTLTHTHISSVPRDPMQITCGLNESQSIPGIQMVYPEPCKALPRRICATVLAGIVPY